METRESKRPMWKRAAKISAILFAIAAVIAFVVADYHIITNPELAKKYGSVYVVDWQSEVWDGQVTTYTMQDGTQAVCEPGHYPPTDSKTIDRQLEEAGHISCFTPEEVNDLSETIGDPPEQ